MNTKHLLIFLESMFKLSHKTTIKNNKTKQKEEGKKQKAKNSKDKKI